MKRSGKLRRNGWGKKFNLFKVLFDYFKQSVGRVKLTGGMKFINREKKLGIHFKENGSR
jgi:hypothetical protein